MSVKVTKIDRVIGSLFPRWAIRRIKNRAELSAVYDAAAKTRIDADWKTTNYTANEALIADLDSIRARSRAEIRDGFAGRALQGAYRRYTIGTGITAKSQARFPSTQRTIANKTAGKMLEAYNRKLDRLWEAWANDPTACDMEKRKTLYQKQSLWMDELFAAGEIAILRGYREHPEQVGLVIQEIEAEQFNTWITEYGGNDVIGGVELDEFAAAIAFHLYVTEQPGQVWSTKSARVMADQVDHIFRQTRPRQVRGEPMMTAVLRKARDLGMYDQYEMVRAKVQAANVGFVKKAAGDTRSLAEVAGGISAPSSLTSTADEIEVNIAPGMLQVLPEGRDVVFPNATAPNTEYSRYTLSQMEQLAAGAGMDLAAMLRKYTGNFSSQRMGRLDVYAETDPIQQMFIDRALRKIRYEFVVYAILEGKLDAPGFFENPIWQAEYLNTNWQGPPKRYVDPAKEAAAAKILMDIGLLSHAEASNIQSKDFHDTFAQIAEAKEIADGLGIHIAGLTDEAKASKSEPRPGKKQDGLSASELTAAIIKDSLKDEEERENE